MGCNQDVDFDPGRSLLQPGLGGRSAERWLRQAVECVALLRRARRAGHSNAEGPLRQPLEGHPERRAEGEPA